MLRYVFSMILLICLTELCHAMHTSLIGMSTLHGQGAAMFGISGAYVFESNVQGVLSEVTSATRLDRLNCCPEIHTVIMAPGSLLKSLS